MTKEQIFREAMSLDPRERDELAEALWQSISVGDMTAGQISEIHRRIAALDSGQALPIPGEQVMEELRRRFRR